MFHKNHVSAKAGICCEIVENLVEEMMSKIITERKKGKKYGVLKNTLFMLLEAKNKVPSVLWLAVLPVRYMIRRK